MARNDERPYGANRSTDRQTNRPGSRSPGHRGHRDEQPSKGRWNRDDRDRRDAGRGAESASRRPNWTPPEERNRELCRMARANCKNPRHDACPIYEH